MQNSYDFDAVTCLAVVHHMANNWILAVSGADILALFPRFRAVGQKFKGSG
ncbi:MAG: hypothetical protein WDZ52_13495 [Pseudohongiellaceae bacterium]